MSASEQSPESRVCVQQCGFSCAVSERRAACYHSRFSHLVASSPLRPYVSVSAEVAGVNDMPIFCCAAAAAAAATTAAAAQDVSAPAATCVVGCRRGVVGAVGPRHVMRGRRRGQSSPGSHKPHGVCLLAVAVPGCCTPSFVPLLSAEPSARGQRAGPDSNALPSGLAVSTIVSFARRGPSPAPCAAGAVGVPNPTPIALLSGLA